VILSLIMLLLHTPMLYTTRDNDVSASYLHLHFNSAVSVTRSRKMPLTGNKHNALVVIAYDNLTFDKFLRKESKMDFYFDPMNYVARMLFAGRAGESAQPLSFFRIVRIGRSRRLAKRYPTVIAIAGLEYRIYHPPPGVLNPLRLCTFSLHV